MTCDGMVHRSAFSSGEAGKASAAALLVVSVLLGSMPAFAAQTWRGKQVYFGDMHWHSCLSQDAPRTTTITGQYESMLYDYGLDFSLTSEHAERQRRASPYATHTCLWSRTPSAPFRPL